MRIVVALLIFLEVHCLASPLLGILGIFDRQCVTTKNMECPQANVTFWLYTKQTADNPSQLDPLNLQQSDFQSRKRLYILLHGYTGHRDYSPSSHIRPALLAAEENYVISADYQSLVPFPCYFAAVQNVPVASKCLAQLINNMVDQSIVLNEDIHVIGFSLGAHVAGQTANYLKRPLKRITGLDPAKPMFVSAGASGRLDKTDAEFVDIIHTDVLGRGLLRTMGHVDFYPNIGRFQPGCQEFSDSSSCNHDRAPQYYAESISSTRGFWAYSCPSWFHNMFGLCNAHSNDGIMGHHVNRTASGSFFLETSPKSPFALGSLQTDEHLPQRNAAILYDYKNIGNDAFEPQLTRAFDDWTDNNHVELEQKCRH